MDILILSFLVLLIKLKGYQFEDTIYNKGWEDFLSDEFTSFPPTPLVWENNNGIPKWLFGSYIKNGAARKQFGDENRTYSNYLDGWAKLHKFTFDDGFVTFSGRMLETKNYNNSVKANRIVPSITLLKLKPNDWSLLEMVESVQNGYDNANVLLWKLGPPNKSDGQYIAVTDNQVAIEIDPYSLAFKAELKPDILKDGLSMGTCAHWKRELGKTSSINFHMMVNPLRAAYDIVLYRYGNTYKDKQVIGSFPIPHVSLVHSFSLTQNYAVVALYPVTVSPSEMPFHNMHPMETVKRIDGPTYIYMIDLRNGTVLDGFKINDSLLDYSAHHINAWEEDGEVVLDLSFAPWESLRTFFNLDNFLHHNDTGSDRSFNVIKRLRMNLQKRSIVVEDWPNERNIPMLNTFDFPVINPNYSGVRNRYVYGWINMDYYRIHLVKKDLDKSKNDLTWFTPSHYPGEPFFVPRPGAEKEDDGVVMTVVFDGDRGESYLLLLDGQTFTELNRAYLPFRIPFSFHGNWFPELQ